MAEHNSFLIYKDNEPLISNCTDEQAGQIFKALFAFACRGEELETEDKLVAGFYTVFRNAIVRDDQKYFDKCLRNTENGKKGGRPKNRTVANGYEENQTVANGYEKKQSQAKKADSDSDSVPDIDSDIESEIERKRFTKPTIEQVRKYCEDRHNGINAERFINYYESKGWTVGKSPMKDWKAAVRTWEKLNEQDAEKRNRQNKFNQFEQHQYDDWETLEKELGIV